MSTPRVPTKAPLSDDAHRAVANAAAEAATRSLVAPPPAPDPTARRIVDGTKADLESWKKTV